MMVMILPRILIEIEMNPKSVEIHSVYRKYKELSIQKRYSIFKSVKKKKMKL